MRAIAGRSPLFALGLVALLVVLASAVRPETAGAQWVVRSEDGQTGLRLGVLVQGRAEWVQVEDLDPVSQNFYLRRARILFSGEIAPRLSFFLDTDSPNMGHPTAGSASKTYGDVYLQDLVVTYAVRDQVMIDAGLILVPTSYNHLQSAASLLAMDYGPYTFIESGPLEERVGRDTGFQGRAVLADRRLEVRAGLFQGIRGSHSANPVRSIARLSFRPFQTAANGLFYTGTGLGKSRLLQFGAAIDAQKDYTSIHGDAFAEIPIAPASCVTLQADVSSYDGGDFLASMPEQRTYMLEGGYTFLESRLAAWGQASIRDFDDEAKGDQTTIVVGGTLYLAGHRGNLKLGVALQSEEAPSGAAAPPDRTTFLLQYQAFHF